MKIVKYFFEFISIISLFCIFKIIGLRNASNLGSILGKFIGPLFRSKKIIKQNIKTGLGEISEQKESESTADAVNDIESDSYLVEILPSYQNELLPEGLRWETNESDPVFSSNEAKRGGKFNSWILGFPLTLRTVGPDSNGSFATYTRANNLGLVGIHPNTLDYYPVLATHWAFGDDGRTVYYRLNEDATWSDGETCGSNSIGECKK